MRGSLVTLTVVFMALVPIVSSYAAPAGPPSVMCELSVNTEVVDRSSFALPPRGEVVSFMESFELELKLKNLDDSRFELEVLDRIAPTRGYARATLERGGDSIGYSFWERTRLLEIDCRL